jgi:putative ABC transport system permease protein
MIAYAMQVRRKEIAIRKTLGSSSAGILAKLWREHLMTVLISGVVASPVAWYFSSQWLITFTTRITLGPQLFIWPLFTLLAVTLATVSFQTIRAAQANPIDALKNE